MQGGIAAMKDRLAYPHFMQPGRGLSAHLMLAQSILLTVASSIVGGNANAAAPSTNAPDSSESAEPTLVSQADFSQGRGGYPGGGYGPGFNQGPGGYPGGGYGGPSFNQGPGGYPGGGYGGYGNPGGYGAPNGYGNPGGYGAPSSPSSQSMVDVQQRLAELGYYNGPVSGYYDPETEQAIVQFQRNMGLAPDGIVGPRTEAALYGQPGGQAGPAEAPDQANAYGNAPTPGSFIQLNDSGDQVSELQRRLSTLGYYSGSASGVFDQQTQEAVMQFQQANGLSADGVVGPATEDALRNPSGQPQATNTNTNQATEVTQVTQTTSPTNDGLLKIGDSGDAVSGLQQQLQSLGFYDGLISGTYDPQTEAAVMAFQRSYNLTPDGIAGPQVNSTLKGISSGTITATAPSSPSTTGTPAGTATTPTTTSATPSANTANSASNPSAQAATPAQSEQAQLATQQAQLEAEQAKLTFQQNLEEGRYSVAALQRQLRTKGYYSGEVNGVITPETQQAIAAAQQKYGLSDSDLSLNYMPSSYTPGSTAPLPMPDSASPSAVPDSASSFTSSPSMTFPSP